MKRKLTVVGTLLGRYVWSEKASRDAAAADVVGKEHNDKSKKAEDSLKSSCDVDAMSTNLAAS